MSWWLPENCHLRYYWEQFDSRNQAIGQLRTLVYYIIDNCCSIWIMTNCDFVHSNFDFARMALQVGIKLLLWRSGVWAFGSLWQRMPLTDIFKGEVTIFLHCIEKDDNLNEEYCRADCTCDTVIFVLARKSQCLPNSKFSCKFKRKYIMLRQAARSWILSCRERLQNRNFAKISGHKK